MIKNSTRVLVIGTVPSLIWNVTRSLHLSGYSPIVLAWFPISPLQILKECKRYIRWENVQWVNDELDLRLLDQVEKICNEDAIDIVIPADYDATMLLSRCDSGRKINHCLVPEASTIRLLHDKWELSRLLEQMKLPFPESERIESPEDLINTRLKFPIITKPLAKWEGVGFEIHFTPEELKLKIDQNILQSNYPLIAQRFIPGRDVGVSFFSIKGKLIAYSVQETNHKGHRTFINDMRIVELVQAVLEKTQYSGVGNWDARYNPDEDDYRILELNPRFWASLLYVTNAGLNYPDLVARINHWEDGSAFTLDSCDVSLPLYERVVAYLNHLVSRVCLKSLNLWHKPLNQ